MIYPRTQLRVSELCCREGAGLGEPQRHLRAFEEKRVAADKVAAVREGGGSEEGCMDVRVRRRVRGCEYKREREREVWKEWVCERVSEREKEKRLRASEFAPRSESEWQERLYAYECVRLEPLARGGRTDAVGEVASDLIADEDLE